MVATKISQLYFRCVKLFIHKMNCAHNLLFFRFRKISKKTIFSGFLSFFLVKLSKSQSLKLNISRTTWPILMILVSFCRILNGLSDEINLLWRCSSPLKCKTVPSILTATPPISNNKDP